ncbi:MAG: right-handed parallel beta-helix repeat-containing protein [Pseudomonadota bacterium]
MNNRTLFAKAVFLLMAVSVFSGCRARIVVEGQGDVTSLSGSRDCSLEQSPCEFELSGNDTETYIATPRDGWQFALWRNCLDADGNRCTNSIEADVVESQQGQVYPTFAVFEGEGLDMLNADDRSALAEVVARYTSESVCVTRGLPNKPRDASGVINQCIQDAPANSILNLRPGRYLLENPIIIDKPLYIKTEGKTIDSAACALENTKSCAVLVAGPEMRPSIPGYGYVDVRSDNVTLGHLVLDGNRAARLDSFAADECRAGANGLGYSSTLRGNEFTMFSSVIRQTLCGTGFAAWPGYTSLMLVNNLVANNGVHDTPGLWADGFTILDVSNSEISRNKFIDNTDIDFILGGCQDCLIQENVIEHTDSFRSSSFAGLMLFHFPSTSSGDYTGSVTSGNIVNCANKRCGFGLYVGQTAWTENSEPLFGGTVENNVVDNAMLGFNVDLTTGPVIVRNNTVTNSGGVHNTACGARFMSSQNISPESAVDRTGDSNPDSVYDRRSYTGCIPNFTLTSTPAPCSDTQTFPFWDEKGDQCLLSCGSLGGSAALNDACETQGLIDVGEAYDVPFCCAALEDL